MSGLSRCKSKVYLLVACCRLNEVKSRTDEGGRDCRLLLAEQNIKGIVSFVINFMMHFTFTNAKKTHISLMDLRIITIISQLN